MSMNTVSVKRSAEKLLQRRRFQCLAADKVVKIVIGQAQYRSGCCWGHYVRIMDEDRLSQSSLVCPATLFVPLFAPLFSPPLSIGGCLFVCVCVCLCVCVFVSSFLCFFVSFFVCLIFLKHYASCNYYFMMHDA